MIDSLGLKSKDSAFTKFISSTRQVADQGSEEPSDDELDALDDVIFLGENC